MNAAQHILIVCLRAYRLILSPAKRFFLGPQSGCRFTPSCSEYALESVRRHGVLAGGWLGVRRVCRCHPWGGCGYDPVPERKSEVRRPDSKTNPRTYRLRLLSNRSLSFAVPRQQRH